MIFDLAAQNGDTKVATDVIIIGGGIAGLLLAAKLRDRRIRVAVLESGGLEQREETHPLNRVVNRGDHYQGATHGRFRCLGGTSTRWGGALIPFLKADLAARPHLGLTAWPVAMTEVLQYLADVEVFFGVDSGSYEEDFVHQIGADKLIPTGDADFLARFAKWPVFRNRNVATLLKARIEGDPDFSVWINATATGFGLDAGSGRLSSITATHRCGRIVTAAAAQFALCAGAIESTRLLMLLDSQYGGRVFSGCDALGRFFHDHVSARLATIQTANATRLNRMAGFRFAGTTMRSLRLDLSPSVQASEGVTSAFGHISFQAQGASGFEALRNCLRSLQKSGNVNPSEAFDALKDLPYLARVGFWRYVHKQLYWPVPAVYELHVVVEQRPSADNRIALAAEKDVFELPLAEIDWRKAESDCNAFSAFVRHFDRYWRRHGLDAIGNLEWRVNPGAISISDISESGDAFHPGGSTRMGTGGRSAVVDRDLRVYAVANLWVASTSVFPSTASSNPTLTLMLFTLRLADQLAKELGRY